MKQKSNFEKDLDEAFDRITEASNEERNALEKRFEQLQTDIEVLATHLDLMRNLDGQLVHKDSPATKHDGERLIELATKLI